MRTHRRGHPHVFSCYRHLMRRSWSNLVLSCGALIGLVACSGGGSPQAGGVNYVTAPSDPLSAVETLATTPTSTTPPLSSTPTPTTTAPQPYNARGHAFFVSLTGNDKNAGSFTQ